VESRRLMRATPDRIFAHLGRVNHLPRYGAPLWMAADAGEKRRTAHVVTLTGYLIGLPVESMQRITLRPPHALEFKQIRGTLRALSGQCSLHPVEDGTEVRYRLEVDPDIPMIGEVAVRQFFVQFAEGFLDRLKLAAERRAPARQAGRGTGAASQEADADEEVTEAAPEVPALPIAERHLAEPPSPEVNGALPSALAAAGGVAETQVPGAAAPSSPTRTGGRRRRHRRRHRGRSGGGGARPASPQPR
jgi:Polyketide cyclase / dehydrase and lipid transport